MSSRDAAMLEPLRHFAGGMSGGLSRRDFLRRAELLALSGAGARALCGRTTMAQESARTGDAEFQRMLAKWNAVRGTSAAHDVLKRLAGSWDLLLRFHAGSDVWETRCTSRAELLHEGRFLLEQIAGEISAPDRAGTMRPAPYTATRVLGYDNYKKAYSGTFIDNQNSYLLTFQGHAVGDGPPSKIDMFGTSDEPMLDIHDVVMKYVLSLSGADGHAWTVYATGVAENAKLFDFEYRRAR